MTIDETALCKIQDAYADAHGKYKDMSITAETMRNGAVKQDAGIF